MQFDHANGFLRVRVTLDVTKPFRRWILIDSAKRGSTDVYDIEYENIPHFCFSCGRLGHSDLFCPTPGTRDANGNLPFGRGLRAADEYRRATSSESSNKEQNSAKGNKQDTGNSSNAEKTDGEVNSPVKRNQNRNKRKGGTEAPKQVYRKVQQQLLLTSSEHVMETEQALADPGGSAVTANGDGDEGILDDHGGKKKRPTPENSGSSAAAAKQPCPSQ